MSSKKTTTTGKGGGRARKPSATTAANPTSAASPKNAEPVNEETHEERSGRRVPIQLLVDYKCGGSYLFDFCKDLGTGGVFIQTDKPLAMGASIDLTFTIPDSKETVIAKGTVIWVQPPLEGRKDLTPGMGVQFKGFSGEQRRLLENFVQRYHGERLAKDGASDKRAG